MQKLANTVVTLTILQLGSVSPFLAQTEPERPIPYPVTPPAEYQLAIANGTRTSAGVPGPNYWQQWTDYTLRARLFPEEKRLEGSGSIIYHNRSPHALPTLALHLLQNVHAEGVMRNRRVEVTGGVEIKRVAVAGRELIELTRPGQGAGYGVQGTTLAIVLPQPLRSAASTEIEVEWSFVIPRSGAANGRMGWNLDNLFHIAYWYPQMAVFDDVVGWHVDEFLGLGEFYSGFGSYDLTVEVPEGWIAMATGSLENAEEVLPEAVLARYRGAHNSDEVVHVITASDFGPGSATQRSEDGYLSWLFHSDSVRDVAFSAMRESRWDAARTPVGDRDGDGEMDYALVNSFWRTSAPRWSDAWRYAQHSIDFFSRWTGFSYPWPHMTSIEGGGIIGGGMEFPMMTLMGAGNSPQTTDTSFYGLVAHELAHMWVPMIVSTDERRYSWMDEGTTSFNSGHAGSEFWPGRSATSGPRQGYIGFARQGVEGEVMRRSDYHYDLGAYGIASYSKPAMLLNTLRALLGEETFDPAYRKYIRTWAFKHPKPWDFFNFFSAESGTDLDWFWRAWYHETWTLDQAVGAVMADPDGTTIVIEDRGWVPMPARVTITLENGETLKEEVPVEKWLSGETIAEIRVRSGSPVVRVEIDPEVTFPDIDRTNNVWTAPSD